MIIFRNDVTYRFLLCSARGLALPQVLESLSLDARERMRPSVTGPFLSTSTMSRHISKSRHDEKSRGNNAIAQAMSSPVTVRASLPRPRHCTARPSKFTAGVFDWARNLDACITAGSRSRHSGQPHNQVHSVTDVHFQLDLDTAHPDAKPHFNPDPPVRNSSLLATKS